MNAAEQFVLEPIVIIGAGRMGQGLALALRGAGVEVALVGRTRRANDTRRAAVVLIATPDDAIGGVAGHLAPEAAVRGGPVGLPPSRLLDRPAPHALAFSPAGPGALFPLS